MPAGTAAPMAVAVAGPRTQVQSVARRRKRNEDLVVSERRCVAAERHQNQCALLVGSRVFQARCAALFQAEQISETTTKAS